MALHHPGRPAPAGGRTVTWTRPPSALAAAHLRSDIHRRPAHQELGGRARAHGRRHSRHPPRPAHHALDQRGRGLLALRQLGLAAHRPLEPHRLHCCRRPGGSHPHDPHGSRINITTVALALIFAGALGNVHDPHSYGSVVDFIEVHIFSYHWPTSTSPTRRWSPGHASCSSNRCCPTRTRRLDAPNASGSGFTGPSHPD